MRSLEQPDALAIAEFWMAAGPAKWFGGGAAFDAECERWRGLHEKAAAGECSAWSSTAVGSFALIVLLDQIPRNLKRGTPDQFASDAAALAAADEAVESGHDRVFPMPFRNVMYLPYQHAEDEAAQLRGLDLYRAVGDQEAYYWALVHAEAIRRFGRFPHRNTLLGRTTTAEEEVYLSTGGFGA